MLWADSADDKLMIFFLFFPRKQDLTIHTNSHQETICMRCQILFSRKNKKNLSKCHLLKFLPTMQSVEVAYANEYSYMCLAETVPGIRVRFGDYKTQFQPCHNCSVDHSNVVVLLHFYFLLHFFFIRCHIVVVLCHTTLNQCLGRVF